MPPFNQLSPAEQAEFHRRFPHAGWWVGAALPPPPDLAPYYHPNGPVVGEPHPLMGPGVPAAQTPPYRPVAPVTYYREEVAHTEPPSTQVHAALARTEQPVTHLDYSVPQNTSVVGAVVTRSTLRLPCDITFADFWDRVCAKMDLVPTEAELGYKFSTDRVGEDLRTLANEQDLATAIDL
ncbi:hypothetical protein PAXINDRAFT_19354, partial [Paxillus involutus ATCC 200175]